MVEAAGFVIQGLGGEYDSRSPGFVDVVIPEGEGVNNTLCVHNCPAFRELSPPPGERERAALLTYLEDGVSRLNRLIRPNPEFGVEDIVHIADMCGFDTAHSGWSPWCRVLTAREWDVVGYLQDVERWYRVGAGGVSSVWVS